MKSKMQIGSLSTLRLQSSLCSRVLLSVFLLAVPLLTSCGGGGNAAVNPPPPPPAVAVTISPSAVTLPAGGSQTFTPAVTGTSNTVVMWSVREGAGSGTITSAGVYTAPQALGTYHVIATSQADSSKTATATVTVPPPSVSISPKTVTMGPGGTLTFTATVIGLLNQTVTWTVQEGAAGGAITTGGVYTAPRATGTFHVMVTSVADPTKSDTAIVTILPISVSISPLTDTLGPGSTRSFTAFVSNSTDQAVTWTIEEGTAGGTITNAGVYTAPATLGTFHVVATSVADPSKNAVATVTVVPAGFKPTGSMATAREDHTATLLSSGKVLVAGGVQTTPDCGCGLAFASAELFDPVNGTFTAAGGMSIGRASHTATLLPNGKVLVAGGSSDSSAELYDPATGSFALTGSMSAARAEHTATLLPNGKVLVTGGVTQGNAILATAEFYDPANATFAPTGSMGAARIFHSATLLPNGKVLITGGETFNGNSFVSLSTAELYDPATGSFADTASMSAARARHTATLLPNGKVLVAGGFSRVADNTSTSAELYDPATGSFTPTGSMGTARDGHTATLLPNGKVLVAGGFGNTSAELYDATAGSFALTGSMVEPRGKHTAILLPSGKVLATGGFNGDAQLASAELYQ